MSSKVEPRRIVVRACEHWDNAGERWVCCPGARGENMLCSIAEALGQRVVRAFSNDEAVDDCPLRGGDVVVGLGEDQTHESPHPC